MKNSINVLYLLAGLGIAQSAPLDWSKNPSFSSVKGKSEFAKIYSLKGNEFDNSFLKKLVEEFSVAPIPELNRKEEIWSYSGNKVNVSFSSETGEYSLINFNVQSYDSFNDADVQRLEAKADRIAQKLMGNNFRRVNEEVEKKTEKGEYSTSTVSYYGFRYLPVVDNRYVLGMEAYLRIAFGKDDKIQMLAAKPLLISDKSSSKKAASSSQLMNQFTSYAATRDTLKPRGKELKINKIVPKNAVLAYYPLKKAGVVELHPGTLFVSDLETEEGTVLQEDKLIPE